MAPIMKVWMRHLDQVGYVVDLSSEYVHVQVQTYYSISGSIGIFTFCCPTIQLLRSPR